jgi:hypothetical protein
MAMSQMTRAVPDVFGDEEIGIFGVPGMKRSRIVPGQLEEIFDYFPSRR